MSATNVHLQMRAAARSRLLTAVALSYTATTISAAGSTLSDSANGLAFAPGEIVTISGFAAPANALSAVVVSAAAGALVIDKALETEAAGQAVTLAAALPPVAWEGVEFFPEVGTPYVSEAVQPVASLPRALGIGGTIAHTMNLSLTLHYPAGNGTVAVERMAGALLDLFRPGTTLSYGSTAGVVTQAERRSLLIDADWISCPVTITAVAYTTN